MKAQQASGATGYRGRQFAALLAIILAVLFAKSFLPNYVHFSNDGPLGEINAAWGRFPSTLTGTWDDLNDIGTSGGSGSPDFTAMSSWLLGPVAYAKFYVPIAMFILGVAAWTFFRQLKLSPLAAGLGALATSLNSNYMGNACWGTVPQQIAMAMVFFALALVMSNSDQTPRVIRWLRLILAGMAVGISVMEGADNGAIFSLFVAAYVFYKSIAEDGLPVVSRIGRGVGRVAVIALFAALIAAQTITALVGTFIVGAAGMGKDTSETPQQHWDWATEWSLPKTETLGIFVPGLFGYRMDTPKYMMDFLQASYKNGEYWGGVGRTPELDRYFDSGSQGEPPQGAMMRFGYAGYYCGILVAIMALFAIVQSVRGENSLFPKTQRHFVWFWTAALIIALLLAWGRFAPFYQFLYKLPYFSTIRNPAKFLAIFYLGTIINFAYGIDALSRHYLKPAPAPNEKPEVRPAESKGWWSNLGGFERNWILFCIAAFVISVIAFAIYKSQTDGMVNYLQKVGFDEKAAGRIFAFSVGQVGLFLLYFAVAIVLVILTISGFFSGNRARLGGLMLGLFLVADLARADLPWIIHWDYKQKYASNPIIDILRDKPYEHRVTGIPSQSMFQNLYSLEWMQHHFPYYNVQCSDVIQSPRIASDLANYDMALRPTPEAAFLIARKWQLTNTRYLLGPANYLESLNEELDPVKRRFQIAQRFSVGVKEGVDQEKFEEALEQQVFYGEQLTAIPDTNGDYALFEFTGALPRAKLYSNWQVNTNPDAVLQTLTDKNFDPQNTVLVSGPLAGVPASSDNENSGTVDYKSYSPKHIVLSAQADKPSILLLNDKIDPGWRVSVDGKPAQLLRCNYIMRGAFLEPGSHIVEFQFEQPHGPLYITILVMISGILLCVYLYTSTHKPAPVTRRPTQDLPLPKRQGTSVRR